MEGNRTRVGGLAPLVVFLLLVPMLPAAQAQSGAVMIELDSFGIEDYASIESENLTFALELHETSGFQANVSLSLRVESLEGTLISNETQTIPQFGINEERNLSLTVLNLPFGYNIITAELFGDIGSNTSEHVSALSRTVQRLRPLQVSLGGLTSVLAQGVDGTGAPTANLTLHDGDHLEVAFPIVNDGDVNWNGGAIFAMENGGSTFEVLLENLTVGGSSSQIFTAYPSLRLVEGNLSWWLNLTGNLGEETGVHSLSGVWGVLPPPLPVLNGLILSDADERQAGENLSVEFYVWNNGTVAFQGGFVCYENGEEVLNITGVIIEPESEKNWSVSRTAKPMLVDCVANGGRIDAGSSMPVSLVIAMPSAVFESAGSTAPTLNGGPWHKGDTVDANMLLRNTGTIEGRVRLVLSAGSTVALGDWLVLQDGSAGEISASLQLSIDGEQSLTWTIESDNGAVYGANNGTVLLNIQPQQSVDVAIKHVSDSEASGLEFTVQLELDNGRSRNIILDVGYGTADSTVYVQTQELLLQQGVHDYTFTLYDTKAESVEAKITPLDWFIGPGPMAASASLPGSETVFSLDFSMTTTPLRPVRGDEVTVELNLVQRGPYQNQIGDVWITDSSGVNLAKVASPDWAGETSQSLSVNIPWPEGSNVVLEAVWSIDGSLVTAEMSFISGQEIVEEATPFPMAAVAYGLALGAVLSIGLRLRYKSEQDEVPPARPSTKTTTGQETVQTREKREISCPECTRKLRVPFDYTGSVGCPDCGEKFSVEAEKMTREQDVLEDDDTPEVVEQVETVEPTKVEIGCPECDQILRIPSDYQGSVRCPACTHIFKSYDV